ncbi:MAG: hypothetical protein EPO39_01470 [Candidatus Manganitrophaceae bacterium]|nr:MAG: hypothetical protein EPO39_01470 [Candidatus Manganitrophaceae bacterium]
MKSPRRFYWTRTRSGTGWLFLYFVFSFWMGSIPSASSAAAEDRSPPEIEIIGHEWHPDEVWELIGKTKFIWKATLQNHSDVRKRVFVYYDLLDDENKPLASNVANKFIEPRQTAEIVSDSYINSALLPQVTHSRVTVKTRFPH